MIIIKQKLYIYREMEHIPNTAPLITKYVTRLQRILFHYILIE